MKFVVLSDTHCRHRNVKLPKGDVVLHAGDVSATGKKAEVLDFLEWFSGLPFAYKIFIAGNHDFYFERESPSAIKALLPQGIVYLNDSGVHISGINIWGSPVTPWFYNWAFNRQRGAGIRKHWNLIPGNTDILITHGPVYGVLDAVVNGQHCGCKDLLEKVEAIEPKVHICGHIHEAYGRTKKFGVQFFNACVLNESYELVNKPIAFDV